MEGKLFAVATVRRRLVVDVVVPELQEDVVDGGGTTLGSRTQPIRAGVNFKSTFLPKVHKKLDCFTIMLFLDRRTST